MVSRIWQSLAFLVIITKLVTATVSTGHAHELQNLDDKTQQLNDLFSREKINGLSSIQADPEARSVYSRLLLWNVGQVIRICFVDGKAAEKELFISTVKELFSISQVNLKADFGGASFRDCSEGGKRSDVRVSFSSGCCSAYIGRVAHYPSIANEPTLMIQGVGGYELAQGKQIIIHEMMHALGFDHEHQAPENPCEFVKSAVKARTGWDDDAIETNLSRLNSNISSYKWTSYDNKSIMKYYFYPNELVGGTDSPCYSSNNLNLSNRDIKGLQDAYPLSGGKVDNRRSRDLMTNIGLSSKDSAIRRLSKSLSSIGDD